MLTRLSPTNRRLPATGLPLPAQPRVVARQLLLELGVALASLLAASLVVAVLEQRFAVPDASAVYIVAVVVMATVFGTTPAVLTALAAFLFYDFLFTQPYFTFAVADAGEWVNLVLFLLIAVVVGRLAALQTERAAEADRRAREAQALFAISRTLATASTVAEAAPAVLARLAADTGMSRIWFSLASGTGERTVVDSAAGSPRPQARSHWTLVRTPGDRPAQWARTHLGGEPGRAAVAPDALYRIRIEAESATLGSLWAVRPARSSAPGREETRLLALAADQLGLALHRDELAAAATAAEVARQSDALKTALLTSVSHDLRTPLAGIRAAAGSLMDPAVEFSPAEARETARTIDGEADRLNRLVRNLLDLSRIEGGALRPTYEVFDPDDLVEPVVRRMEPLLAGRTVEVAVPPGLPPVRVDAVYVDEALTNLLENAARYGGERARIRVVASALADGYVRLTVEDDGPGVPAASLPLLFDKFYRAAPGRVDSRRGMGIGMSVVKGFVEAMGGRVGARAGALGGLAVDIDLPAAPEPAASPGE